MLPNKRNMLQQNPFARLGCFGTHQCRRSFPGSCQHCPQGCAHGACHTCANGAQTQRQIQLQMQARQGIHDAIRRKNHPWNQRCANGSAHNAAANCRNGAIEDELHSDGAGAIAHGFDGADFRPLLLHHSGHGGQAHQRRHNEENHREHIRQIVHALGILIVAHKAIVAAPIQYINVRRLDFLDLLLGIVNLLLTVGYFLIRFGLGILQLLLAVLVFLLAVLQLLLAVRQLRFSIGNLGFIFGLRLSIIRFSLI